jgi:hypothetical protein
MKSTCWRPWPFWSSKVPATVMLSRWLANPPRYPLRVAYASFASISGAAADTSIA